MDLSIGSLSKLLIANLGPKNLDIIEFGVQGVYLGSRIDDSLFSVF